MATIRRMIFRAGALGSFTHRLLKETEPSQ
jgi:hypothetical protein